MPALLELRGIKKHFGATIALGGVDLSIIPGEVHALVGENGAGKSTLMKVLAGIHQPDAGSMTIEGQPYAPRGPSDARANGIMMVNQELAIAPHLTVAANIMLGAEPSVGPILQHQAINRRAKAALTELGRPDIPLDAQAGELGIAEQQLIEIARALAVGCRVLVLDEPTSSLTAADTEKLFALIRRLRGQGTAIVYISHFLEEVQALSDRCTVLRDGATVASAPTSELSTEAIVGHMVGRQVDELYHRIPRKPSWREGAGYLSEDRKTEGLALNLSLSENLTLPRLPALLNPTRLAQETSTWLEKIGVRAAGPNQAVGELSGGNQQKIAFGRLLRNNAEILLLDEPTRGIDIGAKQTLYGLINELAGQGKAVLIVSSYLPELLGTCDRIAVMCRGTLGPARPVAECTEHSIMLAATGATADAA